MYMYFRDIEVADFSDPPPNFKFGLSGTLTGGFFFHLTLQHSSMLKKY